MNRILTLTGAALITGTLVACSPGIHALGHSITFDSSGMVVHAAGHPDAHITRNGELDIDGKAVAVTPAQRQLLQRYYRQALDAEDSGEAMGKQGVQMATHGIGAAIHSVFHGDSSRADKQLDAQSKQIEAAADQLCANVEALGATQKAIAAGVPAFAPYAAGNRFQCTVTHTTTIKTDGAESTSFTYSLKESQGQDATTARTSSRQTGSSSGAKPSSQP